MIANKMVLYYLAIQMQTNRVVGGTRQPIYVFIWLRVVLMALCHLRLVSLDANLTGC